MRRAGSTSSYLHRVDRRGFKAGALEAGLKEASGQFIAIFDADFVPPKDFLMRTLGYFEQTIRRSGWCRRAGATSTATIRC